MTPDTGSIDFTRTLPVSPDQLWGLLTDPKHRERWGAPSDDAVLVMESADLRVGGQDRHRCGPLEAPDFTVLTRWYHLEAPARAVFTETLVIAEAAIFTSLVTYVLSPASDGTRLAVTVALSSFTGEDATADVQEGWTAGLANLDRYIATLSAKA
jgi:uncharacterized protein YndB with AHSA1/START domain